MIVIWDFIALIRVIMSGRDFGVKEFECGDSDVGDDRGIVGLAWSVMCLVWFWGQGPEELPKRGVGV